MKGNNGTCTKRVPKRTRYFPPTVGGSVGEEIGITLFWDWPIVYSHLASDSIWYNEVASLYFQILPPTCPREDLEWYLLHSRLCFWNPSAAPCWPSCSDLALVGGCLLNHHWHVSWRAWIWGRSEEPTVNQSLSKQFLSKQLIAFFSSKRKQLLT